MSSVFRPWIVRLSIVAGIIFAHFVLFTVLAPIVVFRSASSNREEQVFQLVKVAPPVPPPPLAPPPPQEIMPPAPLTSGDTTPPVSIPLIASVKASLLISSPPLPSTTEMLAKLPSIYFGQGNGQGDSSGDGNGDEAGQGGIDSNSSDQSEVKVQAKKEGSTLIFDLLLAGDIEGAKKWLADGNDPNISKPVQDHLWWPIYTAVRSNRPDLVKLLLEHGANPDPIDTKDQRWSRTILAAIFVHSPEILKLLLDYGAKPDYGKASDPDYATSASWTRHNGANSVLSVIEDDSHLEAYTTFTRVKQVEILKLLLEHGADPLWKDNAGMTPLALAQQLNRPDLVVVIEDSIQRTPAKSSP